MRLRALDRVVYGAGLLCLLLLAAEWRRQQRRTAAVWDETTDEGPVG